MAQIAGYERVLELRDNESRPYLRSQKDSPFDSLIYHLFQLHSDYLYLTEIDG